MSVRYPHADPDALPFLRPLKRRIASEVVSIFNDRAKGQKPVQRRPDGLFGPQSVVWRVHGDVTAMMVGGISGLLLQMLHPAVLAGVWDHSNFRDDMLGRLRRTARFIALTSYGGGEDAEAAIARVRSIHAQVGGVLPDGSSYRADDPRLLAWVHVTEASSFLAGWIRYAEPRMPAADRDRYFAEMARLGEALGADPVPRSQVEAQRLIEEMRPELGVDARTREVAGLVLDSPAHKPSAEPLHKLTMQAAVDLLPDWARRMHGLSGPGPLAPLVRAGTSGVARTLRWAFA
ncbi:oxygenase MpaB family protein [Sphingomonas tabacisoli]|uniref:Oxygenase MpaB family protein n=1 Tax=Sphingomonas tabacisoli TaxID=2249466 RepID=A0ABW4I2D2_9SPHN